MLPCTQTFQCQTPSRFVVTYFYCNTVRLTKGNKLNCMCILRLKKNSHLCRMKNIRIKEVTRLAILLLGILCIVASSSCSRKNGFTRTVPGNGSSQKLKVEAQYELPDNLPIYRKNNLETLVLGRNRIEIEQMMGPPEGRSLDGGNGYLWDYRRPVYDEASDTVYAWSLVSFKFLKGLCAYVNIRLENPPVQLIKDSSVDKTFLPDG